MQFEGAIRLANDTPTGVLCEAWGEGPEYVVARKLSEHPLTVKEAGALAEVHGMNLLDVLAL